MTPNDGSAHWPAPSPADLAGPPSGCSSVPFLAGAIAFAVGLIITAMVIFGSRGCA